MVNEDGHAPTSARPAILVVEDRRADQLLLGHMLHDAAHVTFASSGVEAITAWEETSYAAVLMDVQMPGLNGYDTVAALREHERRTGRPRVPIVGVSARDVPGDREAALAVGMDEYLTKPLHGDRLIAALERFVPDLVPADADRVITLD